MNGTITIILLGWALIASLGLNKVNQVNESLRQDVKALEQYIVKADSINNLNKIAIEFEHQHNKYLLNLSSK